ncbi:MAG: phosphate butyryltransferase [Candidatus Zixiibacteriota bacterium]|nr:MAG: phosphate butyryltransferase [candidate division Zixibacteria bacterium]
MKLVSIHSSDEIIKRAVEIAAHGRRKRVAVAAAQNLDVIRAVAQASDEQFLDATLVGDSSEIDRLARENRIEIGQFEVIHEPDIVAAAHTASRLAGEGRADIIMKGFLPTSALLKVVLDKRYGLAVKDTLSHCAVLDIPGYHKLLNMTDGGVVVKPDRQQKFQILQNAVAVCRALGLSPVKVAVSGAYDKPLEKLSHAFSDMDFVIPEAMDKLKDILIQGPLPFDLATSKSVADPQQSEGTVVGDADIYLVDSIEECNIIAKSLIRFAGAVFAGVIVGAKVPISLVSRTDSTHSKKVSLALACLVADYCQNDQSGKGTGDRYGT